MANGCGDVLSLEDLKSAKKHQLFEAEVITGKTGGVSGGANIDYATNAVTGQVQKTMPAILRDIGFRPAAFDFDSGGTIGVDDRDLAVLWPAPGGDNDWYYWEGALPKVIPASSTPLTTGGIADGAWRPVGDITLRGALADTTSVGAGDALIGVKQPFPGAVARTQHDKNAEVVSISDFGAVAGGGDCAPAFQAAIDAIGGRGAVIVPPGVFTVASGLTVTNNVTIRGSGIGASLINFTATNTILFDIGDGTGNPNNCFIQDLQIISTNVSTADYVVRIRNGHNCGVQNVRFDGGFYRCIGLFGGAEQFTYKVQDVEINGATSTDTCIYIGDSEGIVQDIFLNNLVIGNAPSSTGIMHKWCGGVYASNVDVINAKWGIAFVPDDGQTVKGSFYNQVLGDTCTEFGFIMQPNAGGVVVDNIFTGCWGSSNGTTSDHAGVFIDGSTGIVGNLNFVGLHCVNNKGDGILIIGSNVKGVTLSGTTCASNSMVGSGVKHGLELGAGVSNVSVVGGNFGQTESFGFNNQNYGVFIAAGTGDNISLIGSLALQNVTGAVSNGATGSNIAISGVSGYRTKARGSAKITSGSSSVTVNPAVAATLSATAIQVTPTTDLDGLRWWVTQSGSALTINLNEAASSDKFFSWSVDVSEP